MSTSFYVYETQYKHARQCDQCSNGMNDGYLFTTTDQTFCSNECLDKAIPEVAQADLILEELLFWTDWHDEVGSAE